METLTGGRHVEGLFIALLLKDWETALTVILRSPRWTKRVHPMLGSPLDVAIEGGAPVEVLIALLEAYPDATTILNKFKNLPCYSACCYGISSKGMKMLLLCNPDAGDAMSQHFRQTPLQCLRTCQWSFFADEKEQVMNDVKQHSDQRRSVRRSVVRMVLGRLLDNIDLVPLIFTYLTLYEADNILELKYKYSITSLSTERGRDNAGRNTT
jgi:hypothetical protein